MAERPSKYSPRYHPGQISQARLGLSAIWIPGNVRLKKSIAWPMNIGPRNREEYASPCVHSSRRQITLNPMKPGRKC